jgi:hypothetical protein
MEGRRTACTGGMPGMGTICGETIPWLFQESGIERVSGRKMNVREDGARNRGLWADVQVLQAEEVAHGRLRLRDGRRPATRVRAHLIRPVTVPHIRRIRT